MAQRTGADDFLAPRAKTRSAATAALLVAALLALSGCGGDSEDPDTASSAPAPAATEETEGNPSEPSSSPSASAKEAKTGGEGSDQGAQGTPNQSQGKQGKQIVLPKGSPEPGPSPAERAQATIANIALASPALPADPNSAPTLPAPYTCAGKDESPPLRWTGIPPGTAELVLFAMNSQPVGEKLFFDWAVAGIGPDLTELEAGELPKGAVVGKNDFGKTGYSICPPTGSTETYIFALYALPQRIEANKGFDPFALRTKILEISGNVGLLAASAGR